MRCTLYIPPMNPPDGNAVPDNLSARFSLARQATSGYELQKLRENHHLILRLYATGRFTQKQIAELLGVTEVMVNYTVNSGLGQQKLAVMRGEADGSAIELMKELFNLAPVAVEELESIMTDRSVKASVRARVALGLLDRAGYNPTQKIAIAKHVDDEVLEAAKRKALEQGIASGQIVDATIIEEDGNRGVHPTRAAGSDRPDDTSGANTGEEVYRQLSRDLEGAGGEAREAPR